MSRNIQSLAVPRVGREGPREALDSHSADKAREDDSLCQKSELAIGGTQTSRFQKRLDGALSRLFRKGIEVKQKYISMSRISKRTRFPDADPSKKYKGKARELRLVSFSGPPRRPREASLSNASGHRNIHIPMHNPSQARKA